MLELTLLGSPRATRDGAPVEEVRGAKAWALLAYLWLADGPVERARLSRLLFPDATDPGASLRWNLSQLRRGLGVSLDGDPVVLGLPSGTRVDLEVLANRTTDEAARVAVAGQPLLADASFACSDEFTLWLEGERRHLTALTADVLREAAVGHLARGEADEAVSLAERVVHLAPFDENAAALLIRSLREAGRGVEARALADTVAERFRDELGVEPSAMLWSAAHASTGGPARVGGRPAVEAQLDAGEAALAAGVPDAGLDALRGALGGARALGEPDLSARCLAALGSALIHAVRGSDQDGLALLHEAIPLAAATGQLEVSARANRELGYVDLLRGRYERARRWFDVAAVAAAGNDEELGWIAAWAGAARTDVADYPAAAELLDEAVGRTSSGGSAKAEAMARAMRGRLRLLDDDPAGALVDLERSAGIAHSVGWRAFLPWPQTLRAEIVRGRGDIDDAMTGLHAALATSRQIGDPCWESMALRGLGLATVAGGDLSEGLALLQDAPRQCRRLPDTYLWVEAHGLDALADVASRRGLPEADAWIQRLEDISVDHGMRALSRNAAGYRRR